MSEDRVRPPTEGDKERGSEVLTALPRSRPHRRSQKRTTSRTQDTAGAQPTPAATMKQSSSGAAVKKPGSATAVKKPGSAPASVARSRSGSPRLTSAGAGTLKASSDGDKAKTLHQPPQPRGLPPQPEHRKPIRPKNVDILATAVQAAAELTEIGLSAGARALRDALSRLPRP